VAVGDDTMRVPGSMNPCAMSCQSDGTLAMGQSCVRKAQ
jgi:hypothetical protein